MSEFDENKKIKELESLNAITVVETSADSFSLKYNNVVKQYEYTYSDNRKIITKKELGDIVTPYSLPLVKVSKDEIIEARRTKKPGFFFKKNGSIYYAEIPGRLHFEEFQIGNDMKHLCSYDKTTCKRFTPLPFEHGGCPKIFDGILRIERYKFILDGFEVFNTSNNRLVVLSCKYFEASAPRKIVKDPPLHSAKRLADMYKEMSSDTNSDDESIFPSFDFPRKNW